MSPTFSDQLINWYKQYGRHDLPWQNNPTAYRVWISEIMLQQTQVTTVIPYYERFMRDFPTIAALVSATEDDVLSHWSGLGYYARARNIYKTAKIIYEKCNNQFPSTIEALTELPGIGKSTAGAIVSFSQQKKAVILDGNVKRVLARYYAIEAPVNQASTIDTLWEIANELTPEKNAHRYNQAIMDLGATLCTRTKPRCHECPFQQTCQAYQNKTPTFYPIKIDKKVRPVKKIHIFIITNSQQDILLCKRPAQGIWGGLWSLPESGKLNTKMWAHEQLTLKLKHLESLPKITHQLTHFILEIFPHRFQTREAKKLDSPNMIWYNLSSPLPGGVAAPIAKILQRLTNDT